jgi:hypothetical protein
MRNPSVKPCKQSQSVCQFSVFTVVSGFTLVWKLVMFGLNPGYNVC